MSLQTRVGLKNSVTENLPYSLCQAARFFHASTMKSPVKVAVTGAGGQLSYSLLFPIASGSMLQPDQPLRLHLIGISPDLPAPYRVVSGLGECPFPPVSRSVSSDQSH